MQSHTPVNPKSVAKLLFKNNDTKSDTRAKITAIKVQSKRAALNVKCRTYY